MSGPVSFRSSDLDNARPSSQPTGGHQKVAQLNEILLSQFGARRDDAEDNVAELLKFGIKARVIETTSEPDQATWFAVVADPNSARASIGSYFDRLGAAMDAQAVEAAKARLVEAVEAELFRIYCIYRTSLDDASLDRQMEVIVGAMAVLGYDKRFLVNYLTLADLCQAVAALRK